MKKPFPLFDNVIHHMRWRNDAQIAREIDVRPPTISKMRSGTIRVGATTIIYLHEATDIPVSTLKGWLKESTA